MSQEEVGRALEKLQRDVDKLANEAAKRLAVDVAEERIAAWEKRRLGLILVILALFGIATYASLTDKVANYFVESVKPRIDDEVKKKTAFVSARDPAIPELQTQMADLSQNVANLSKNFATDAKTKPVAPPPTVVAAAPARGGYAFFGVRDASGQWTERYFDVVGDGNRPPKAGDRLSATASLNIRQGYIVYTDAGWVNKPSTGLLRRGDFVRVNEVREVVAGFWWVSFTPDK